MKDARSSTIGKYSGEPKERAISSRVASAAWGLEVYRQCRCQVARSSPEISKSAFAPAIAAAMDCNGAKPRNENLPSRIVVLAIGLPEGQTACTEQPAFVRATARRAVGNQRDVVTTRTVGFNVLKTFPRVANVS